MQQHQFQINISQAEIAQISNINKLSNCSNNESPLQSHSTVIYASPDLNPSLNVSSQAILNQTILSPSILIDSHQNSQSSSSLLTLSNIANTSSNSTNSLINCNLLENLDKSMDSNQKNKFNSTTISSLKSNTSNITSPINSNSTSTVENFNSNEKTIGHGHFFSKKTFHKPTFCHHCTEMLWGLIGQGFICEGT